VTRREERRGADTLPPGYAKGWWNVEQTSTETATNDIV